MTEFETLPRWWNIAASCMPRATTNPGHNGPAAARTRNINQPPHISRDGNSMRMGANATIKPVKHIGIALFDGFALCEIASVIELFQAVNARVSGDPWQSVPYKVHLLSAAGGCVASASSVDVWTQSIDALPHAEHFDTLFVAGGTGRQYISCDRRLAWLRRACERAGRVYPVGEGRELLEEAGLTCSRAGWWTDEGPSAGAGITLRSPDRHAVSPAIRVAFGILEEDVGSEVVRQIAHPMMSPGLAPRTAIVCRSAACNVSERIRTAARWLEVNGHRPVAMGQVAQVAAMSGRNFLRRFKAEMGTTPYDYLLHLRLERCCRLLVETRLPVDKIARRCGMGSGGRLAKLFRKHLGKTPTEYRAIRRRSSDSSQGN